MGEEMKVKLTCEEGDILLQMSAGFALPEKIGDQKFTVGDRAVAGDEVKELYTELRAHSPMMMTKKRIRRFGPAGNIVKKVTKEDGEEIESYEYKDRELEVEVRLNEDAVSGVMWCVLAAVAPAPEGKLAMGVELQTELFWPIAKKLDRVEAVRELVGFSKGTHRRWKTDDEFAKDKKSPESPKA